MHTEVADPSSGAPSVYIDQVAGDLVVAWRYSVGFGLRNCHEVDSLA
jgi:hypothetical protein